MMNTMNICDGTVNVTYVVGGKFDKMWQRWEKELYNERMAPIWEANARKAMDELYDWLNNHPTKDDEYYQKRAEYSDWYKEVYGVRPWWGF